MKSNQKRPARSGLTLRTLLIVLREKPLVTAGLALSILASAALAVIPPQLLRLIIDEHLTPGIPAGLGLLAALYLLSLIAAGVADFAKGTLLTVSGQSLVRRLRLAMWQKLSRIESRWFSQSDPASITSRFISDADNVSSLFSDGLAGMAVDCLKIIGILVSIALFSPWLLLIAAVFLPAVFAITRYSKSHSFQAQVKNLEQLARVNSHIAETVNNLPMIRGFAREDFMEKAYVERLRRNFDTIEAVNFYDAVYPAAIYCVRSLALAAIVVAAASGRTGLTIGMAAAAIELFISLFKPIESLGMELQTIQKGLSGIARIDTFDTLPEEPARDVSLTAAAILAKNEGTAALSFANVHFAYDADEPVLRGISFAVPAGASVTLSGRTGVGKTTLFRLTMGLLAPGSGSITLNGVPVAAIPNSEKRRLFGYVEQRFSFIRGTVLEQITLGDPSVTRAAAAEALDFVGLGDTVAALPQGLDTPVSEGSAGFSQGQKQLLAIARAIAAKPAVLLLDEVTANLDSETEAHVVGVLARAGAGRTVLSISHRLTSMLRCDEIVLLENGLVRAHGAPADLAEHDAAFRHRLALEQSAW